MQEIKSKDILFDLELSVSVVTIGILMVLQLVVARVGMKTDYWTLSSLLGLISLIVISPQFLKRIHYLYEWTLPLIAFGVFIIILMLGALNGMLFPQINFQIIITALGLASYILAVLRFVTSVGNICRVIWWIPIWIILASRMQGFIYDYPYKLLDTGSLASSDQLIEPLHQDFFYHASISAMAKTNIISTSGLHGFTPIDGHTWSHIINAWLSNLTSSFVADFYSYLLPIFFFTLLLYVLSYCIYTYNSKVLHGQLNSISVLSCIGLLILFRPLSVSGSVSHYLFGSPSFGVAIILSLWLITLTLSYRREVSFGRISIAVIVMCLPYIKISTGFVVLPSMIYLMLRFRHHIKPWDILFLGICVIVMISAYFSHSSFYKYTGDATKVFSILGGLRSFPAPHGTWIFAYGISFWLYVVLRFRQLNISTMQDLVKVFLSGKSIDLEIATLVFLTSIIPTALLVVAGNSNLYFGLNQLWYSNIILSALLLWVISKRQHSPTTLSTWLIAGILVGGIFDVAQLSYLNQKAFWTHIANNSSEFLDMVNYIRSGNLRTAVRQFSYINLYESYLREEETLVNDLMTLRDMKTKLAQNTLLYVPRSNSFWNTYTCKYSGLMLVTVTEFPLLYGMPSSNCYDSIVKNRLYTYAAYDLYTDPRLRIPNDELCTEAARLGFHELVIWEDVNNISPYTCN